MAAKKKSLGQLVKDHNAAANRARAGELTAKDPTGYTTFGNAMWPTQGERYHRAQAEKYARMRRSGSSSPAPKPLAPKLRVNTKTVAGRRVATRQAARKRRGGK